MATTVTPTTLKAKATAFASVADAVVQEAINEAVRWIHEENWGASHFNDGVFYLACHLLAELTALNAAGANPGTAGLPSGAITSEALIDWRGSYQNNEAFNDDAWATTAWGRAYIARRNLVFSDRCFP